MASHDQPEFQQQYTNEYPHDSDKTLERQTTAAHQQAHPHLYANPQAIHPAFGGALQPGLWKPVEHRKFANPAPLGLCAFALTTFVLSCINMHVRGESSAAIAIPVAFGYGGLVQLCAGMWYVYLQPNTYFTFVYPNMILREMAVGNTFGATALSSYGGFWIAYGLLQTPTWNVLGADGPYEGDTGSVMGFFLTGWFIFTTLLLICTLRSTLAFFLLFFFLDICFLLLATENYAHDMGNHTAQLALQKAAGFFGFLAAFMAWYNALAGLQDSRYVFPLHRH